MEEAGNTKDERGEGEARRRKGHFHVLTAPSGYTIDGSGGSIVGSHSVSGGLDWLLLSIRDREAREGQAEADWIITIMNKIGDAAYGKMEKVACPPPRPLR